MPAQIIFKYSFLWTQHKVNSAFHLAGVDKSSTGLWLGLRRGVFTCVGWQVTLCGPMWQVTLRSSEMEFR